MRLLFTIPHYVRPDSAAAGPDRRVHALTACLAALHQHFNAKPSFIHHARRTAHCFEAATPYQLDIVVCTTHGCHLLDRLPVEPRYCMHQPIDVEPALLGFACQAVLRERLGRYDYYCYLEDDLVLHDPWLFLKLAWFNRGAGDDKLLQANRYEAGLHHVVPKVYVDGDLAERVTAPFQDRPAEAAACIRQALEIEPREAMGWLRVGNVLLRQEKHAEAEEAYRKCLELEPRRVEALVHRGFALGGLERLDEAKVCYEQARALDPNLPEVHHNLGNALREQRLLDEAVVGQTIGLAVDDMQQRPGQA